MKKLLSTLTAVGTALFLLFGIPTVSQVTVTTVEADSNTYVVDVATSYLALRNAKAYDYYNEIGKLWKGETVQVLSYDSGTYWYVYAPTLGKSGYVNKNYLKPTTSPSGETYTVSVATGYLALRTAKAYDYSNEIGKLYSGQTVNVPDKSDPTYWWVYAPTLGKSGYVNRNYLIGASPAPAPSGETYTVSVATGYLALRTAKAYDYSNEIGKLYSGQTVTVTDKSDPTYWWVYAPTLGKSGYVNRNYLLGAGGTPSGFTKTVSVATGYLALRTAKAYDYSNEIGKLYSGQTVQVLDTSDSTYWWVYAPTLGKSGYVNRNYLI